ncbi:putative 3-oxoacyl-(acyl-carrier-protein) reductase [Vibrio nigripulchritudo SFn27]|uniref:Putative 3-oxoacyl-[acyl-carrier-protein] reductase n=1 Tax=Vibrio nigripulchritudo TaxID=28173 RepID=U4K0K3_9VIBR|nr:SDR family oxidoreductase [Vibrio nigripulchritudo]CCN82342.1 putative 3-oxoacyl-(acyl-carrier-protein) reductase [Vibrio nigripulchritudo BLFn1]CCN88441.1 putative 3-oxoacyl-(acyl-carrier-protein) reductase [Vibrio nigripulchritudo SFn27]CCN95850.1 putative 3-oxoacyl-(acyl-carrier-protein) reductase [Vibrio nigripulchritudo ENn2]CCO39262.1 putative 3-oxoacyl-(acyl-carrier-protein) reductase [Vibrio nigripulchritudo SFn135]CCO50773.1 putative 3-oxoacyl-(acyl-carrier-protein) reductase [Vibr
MDSNTLKGEVAVVTGGAEGIGFACAQNLAEQGATVILADINSEKGTASVRELQSRRLDAHFVETDVSSTDSMKSLFDWIHAQGWLVSIMVNNAAVALSGDAVDIPEETWNRVLNTNLSGVWRGIRLSVPDMKKRGGGNVVNISSAQSFAGFHGWSAYAAAKGGINALTRQAAIDFAPHNIRINAVAPGTIMTPMNEKIFEEVDDADALRQRWNDIHPIGRFGQPEEVAQAVSFLATKQSSFITGQIIIADGGMLVKGD